MKAAYFAQDFIRDGIPIWWDESDDVYFEIEKKISRSRAAKDVAEERENGKDKKPPHGRYYVPVPKTKGGKPLPSFLEWVEEQTRKNGKK